MHYMKVDETYEANQGFSQNLQSMLNFNSREQSAYTVNFVKDFQRTIPSDWLKLLYGIIYKEVSLHNIII